MQAEEAKSRFCRDFGWSTSLKPREITPQTTSRFPSNHVPFPSNHESISLKPRVDFPQTTSRFPSNHESISLKPRVDFPQTTNRFPSNDESSSLKPRVLRITLANGSEIHGVDCVEPGKRLPARHGGP